MRRILFALSVCAIFGCRSGSEQPVVVVYTALDRVFSEPIFARFEHDTGIKVLAKYDTESTKTIGLVNALRAESAQPRCDVFWSNEIVNTICLKNEGLLQAYQPEAARGFPAAFRDLEGYWTGFAARARVLLVNTQLVKPSEEPKSIFDMADPKWKGKVAMAKPLFGTTATHVACLLAALGEEKTRAFLKSLKDNDVQIQSGNKSCAESVSAATAAFGITDTDDAIIEVEQGKPVKIVYPDSGAAHIGTLFIPNTVSLIKNAPHADTGKKLIEYLLSPEIEIRLSECPSAQIPVNPQVKVPLRVKTPNALHPMAVNFGAAANAMGPSRHLAEQFFLK